MKRFFSVRYLIFLLVSLAVIYYFHINKKRGEDQNIKVSAELADLKAEWLQLKVEQGEVAYATQERDKMNQNRKLLQAEVVEMRESLKEVKVATELLESQRRTLFFEYREQMWREAKGMKFDQIMTQQGKIYRNVEIIEVRPDGILFRFGGAGSASVRGMALHELPAEWIRRFMYTEEKTEAAAILEKLDRQVIGSKIKKGVLSKLEGDRFSDFTMSNAPDYYVVYYSASW